MQQPISDMKADDGELPSTRKAPVIVVNVEETLRRWEKSDNGMKER